jgi:hypothetical protein
MKHINRPSYGRRVKGKHVVKRTSFHEPQTVELI